MAVLANVLWFLGLSALMAAVAAGLYGRKGQWRPLAVSGLVLFAVECALQGQWAAVVWNAVFAVILLGGDWWNRRGRKVAKAVGEKSRALLASIVEKAREAAPAPAPQEARA